MVDGVLDTALGTEAEAVAVYRVDGMGEATQEVGDPELGLEFGEGWDRTL